MAALHDASVRTSIEQRLKSLSPASPRRWGKMSVDQMVWHLNQSLEMALGKGNFSVVKTPLPAPMMRFMVLNLPWPKGAPTHPQCVPTAGFDLEAERQRCLALIAELCARQVDGPWPPSPLLGAMTGLQVSRLQAKHLDHHLRQFSA